MMSEYDMPIHSVSMDLAGRKLTIETGRFALQATGAVTISLDDTVILCTAMLGEGREGTDFFPLVVDYQERFYAAGKMSGSRFVKREGKPSDDATLSCRLIDRPIRPMFPKGITNEVQLITTVMSADLEVHPVTTALIGASAALMISGMPFKEPVSAVRIGLVNRNGVEELVVNPTYQEMEEGRLNLVVAGTEDAITMVEAVASEVSDDKMLEALGLAHETIKGICRLQKELYAKVQPMDLEVMYGEKDKTVYNMVKEVVSGEELDAIKGKTKKIVKKGTKALEEKVIAHFAAQIEAEEMSKGAIKEAINDLMEERMRYNILEHGIRIDGRALDEVRPVSCEVGFLPRTHGSSMFKRGETQIINVCTLGGPDTAQVIESMDMDTKRRYIHHYNFPPFSTGEVKPLRSPGRREIGHGFLAERALIAVLPDPSEFPYAMRTVSETVACNGSSSMGSVCASTLSLMDAGVPIKAPVSAIAMGLVTGENGKYRILSDIQGLEDFAGDMDLKVAGTPNGITALQMDIKIKGLQLSLIKEAFVQAHKGREEIMNVMMATINQPREHLSSYAPVIETISIDPDKIREVIGKGGETIQGIVAETGAQIDIEDDGRVNITAPNSESAQKAKAYILGIATDPEIGSDFEGTVVKLMEFGAFVRFLPGRDGLLHISKISRDRVDDISKHLQVGDKIKVRLVEIDRQGRFNLSHLPFVAGGESTGMDM